MYDLSIHSSRVITPRGIKDATVIIQNGLIREVHPGIEDNDAVIDVGDKIIMPGVIDPHVHINEPGRTSWEGFDSATISALAGGISMLVDMPLNSSPVTTTVDAFEKKLEAAKGQVHTNCGFWGGVIPGNEYEIEGLIEKGVLGFKAFLVDSGIAEFPNATESDLRLAMPIISKHGLPLLVHCELPDKLSPVIGGRRSYRTYLSSRPAKWEDDAISLMIRLCEEFNCPVHIVHLSSSGSITQITEAKEKGLPLTAETGQHYLYFNAESIPDGHTEFKSAPPIREKENNGKLWQALIDGVIDFVATDHSPSPPAMKELQTGDFMQAWGGVSSLQFSLPVLWTAAKKRNIALANMAKWLCQKPSELTGMQDKKGKIETGYDADLVIWDPEKSFTVTEQLIHHKHKITPYLNEELYGVVEQTYLKGLKVFDNGKFLHLNKGRIIINSR